METFEFPFRGRVTLAQHQEVIQRHNDQVREQRQVVEDLHGTIARQAEELEAFRSRQSRLEGLFTEMFSGVVRNIVLDTFRDEILHAIRVDTSVCSHYDRPDEADSSVVFIDPRDGFQFEQRER